MRSAPLARPLEAPRWQSRKVMPSTWAVSVRQVNSWIVIVLPTLLAKASTPAGGT